MRQQILLNKQYILGIQRHALKLCKSFIFLVFMKISKNGFEYL